MNLSGNYLIQASGLAVWQGMNDPALLKRCIAVCESFEKIGAALFSAQLKFKLGPLKVRFTIDVTIDNADPPHAYQLRAEGRGGLAGMGKGIANVMLQPEGADTRLSFTAESRLEGAVARLAAKAIQGAANRYADEFFAAFSREVSGNLSKPLQL